LSTGPPRKSGPGRKVRPLHDADRGERFQAKALGRNGVELYRRRANANAQPLAAERQTGLGFGKTGSGSSS